MTISLPPERPPSDDLAPVRPEERIASLDVLRGVAILGILLTNIYSFALPAAASRHPEAFGNASAANVATWFLNHVLIEGKLRAIFAMLFGASVVLLLGRAERRGAGIEAADVYYRRTLWLIVFGALHGYLIWFGDILFHFGVIGLTLFPLRKLGARTLIVLGLCGLLLHTAQVVRAARSFERTLRTASQDRAILRYGSALSLEQQEEYLEARDSLDDYKADTEDIQQEVATWRGGYVANLKARVHITASLHSDVFYRHLLFDVGGTILIGMGLMRLGVLDGSRSFKFYAWMTAVGYGAGLPTNLVLDAMWVRSDFALESMYAFTRIPYDPLRLAVAAGHIGLIMMICKAGALWRITGAMARVGRMAFSNYILTSVLCSLLFYGSGFGMFGRLQRYQLLYVVAAAWVILIGFSTIWLSRFRFGPLEWLWRSLTYWKLQPMRLTDTTT